MKTARSFLLAVPVMLLLQAPAARAMPPYCHTICTWSTSCSTSCTLCINDLLGEEPSPDIVCGSPRLSTCAGYGICAGAGPASAPEAQGAAVQPNYPRTSTCVSYYSDATFEVQVGLRCTGCSPSAWGTTTAYYDITEEVCWLGGLSSGPSITLACTDDSECTGLGRWCSYPWGSYWSGQYCNDAGACASHACAP